jgi:hypothetical protein
LAAGVFQQRAAVAAVERDVFQPQRLRQRGHVERRFADGKIGGPIEEVVDRAGGVVGVFEQPANAEQRQGKVRCDAEGHEQGGALG